MADDLIGPMLDLMRRVERARRTVVCRPEQEAQIRDAAARTDAPGLFTVVVSEFVPEGQALIIADHVLKDLGPDVPAPYGDWGWRFRPESATGNPSPTGWPRGTVGS